MSPINERQWLKVEGNTLICQCGYTETVSEKEATREELLKQNKALKAHVLELEVFLKDYLANTANDRTMAEEAKRLLATSTRATRMKI